ncbi:MAG: RNA polymerase-binding protein DksA [Alphaproteobacteria bacterium CG_4_10_14_0_2_um_filter_63_37]|nr:MAG: RNA polymerase-binding protein DksA [Proteobacteria bacterium CG1_02_64_396]PJA24503.1 MAG: RNA polymerase-binding protein DksA [Alphaproteobacteria bacterium CG_4_10_14_0_2_um_filter_63_37]
MDEKTLEHFRSKLTAWKQDLLREARRSLNELEQDTDYYPDIADRATFESEMDFELRLRDRERKLINKIDKALERIDNGSYGMCDACGDEIAEARLEMRPVTTYCIECKTRQEQEEKLRGE